jgi:hypothetical protein
VKQSSRDKEENRSLASKARRKLANNARYHGLSWRQQLERRLAKYGWTLDDFDKRWAEIGGNCECCTIVLEPYDGRLGFVIDHNHKTGEVRGILCGPCNRTIGHSEEFTNRLRSCATYLEKFK